MGSGRRSQARPAIRASSVTGLVGDGPSTTTADCKLWAARKMASHFSVAAATARWMVFPFFSAKDKGAGKELLFFQAEKLLRRQFVLARFRASEKSHVEHHHILFARIDAVEYRAQVIKRVVVADHHQDIAGAHSERLAG